MLKPEKDKKYLKKNKKKKKCEVQPIQYQIARTKWWDALRKSLNGI